MPKFEPVVKIVFFKLLQHPTIGVGVKSTKLQDDVILPFKSSFLDSEFVAYK